MPAPRITTDLPLPTFGGQSSGRGESGRGAGGGGGGDVEVDAADEEPQPAAVVLIPMASIARSMAELPTALPIAARNSRLAIPCLLPGILDQYHLGMDTDTNYQR